MQLTLPAADVLCMYGLPDQELYTELKEWLGENPERFLLVLEDDETVDEQVVKNERVRLCRIDATEELKKVVWELVFLQFAYLKEPGNSSKDSQKMEAALAKLAFLQQGVHLVASDFQNRGVDLLHNFLGNSALFSKAKRGQSLFGAFSGVPAVICGAGTSLEKEAPYLRTLKDRALLFAGGTALSSLSQMGIKPHFGGLIDPHAPSNRFFQHQAFEVPLFFQTRAHPQLVKQMQGPCLWMPGSENDLLENEAFDGGWNVSTFLVAIACHLGCSPIILVGVDLAQKEDRVSAGGLGREEEEELIPLENGLYTKRDWVFAADWLSDFAKNHPEVEWVNASVGMEVAGFKACTVRDLSFEKQTDLLGGVHSAIEGLESGITPPFSPSDLEKSFRTVGDLCVEMLQLLERLFPGSPQKSGEYILLELEIEKEIAYMRFLRPIWDVWRNVFSRQIPKDVPPEYGIGLNQWLFIKGICDESRQV